MNKETEMKKLIVICCGLVVGFALLAGLYYADEVETITTFDASWGSSWTCTVRTPIHPAGST